MRVNATPPLVFALSLLATGNVAADETDVCLESHVTAQQTRAEGSMIVALLAMKRCAAATCPQQVRAECSLWRRELESVLGTIEVVVKAPAGTEGAVAILIDGSSPLDPLGGNRFTATAGKHTVQASLDGASPAKVELQVPPGGVARAEIDLVAVAPPRLDPASSAPEGSVNLTVPGAILLGVGGAGLLSFAIAGGLGLSAYNDLDACRPDCPVEQVDDVDAKFLAADISLGVGIGAAAVGIVLVIVGESLSSGKPAATSALRRGPRGLGFRF